MTSSLLSTSKQRLRGLMKTKLSAIPQESIVSQSQILFETLKEFRPYVEAEKISIFLSMPSGEIQTDAIVRHALSLGKHVYIPYLEKSPWPPEEAPPRIMDMVRLRDLEDYDSLRPDKWGIPSMDSATVGERHRILGPAGSQPSEPSRLDLILMPGVAFDIDITHGLVRRLGHGKGFYDFFINRYVTRTTGLSTQHPKLPRLFGLALSEQLVTESSGGPVPVGPHDRDLDGVILGSGEVKSARPP